MKSTLKDLYDVATSSGLTYQQKLFNLANTAERLVDPKEILGYTDEEMSYIENEMICDLNEGYLPYRPRYIVPNYYVLLEKGSEFLDIKPPQDLDELLDSLLILYNHVPSITSFPARVTSLRSRCPPPSSSEAKDPRTISAPRAARASGCSSSTRGPMSAR